MDELLTARGITVSHETVRQWGLKFGQGFANRVRRRPSAPGDKWHLDEAKIAGKKHRLWRAVDRDGMVLDWEWDWPDLVDGSGAWAVTVAS